MANFRKRASGRWQARIRRHGYPDISDTFADKASAKAWAVKEEARLESGGLPISRDLREWTLGQVLEWYIKEAPTQLKKSGLAYAQGEILNFLSMPIAKISLANLRRVHFNNLKNELLKKSNGKGAKLAPTTVARKLTVMRSALNQFVDSGEIEGWEHPMRIRLPSSTEKRKRRIEPDELVELNKAMASCRNPYHPLIVKLAIETGMRRAELLSVEVRNIHSERMYIFLPKSATKTDEGREVPLTEHGIEIVQKALIAKGRPKQEEMLFPVNVQAFKSAWRRIKTRANISTEDDLRFHDTRAECISRCLEDGLSTHETMVQSGHTDPRSVTPYARLSAQKVAVKRNKFAATSKNS
ncbi:MAG: tyrosine-type recombinase/integrase [Gammaproteobacteria bacterium]